MYLNKPMEIENKSMEIIEKALVGNSFNDMEKEIVKRIIHTTGDPGYGEIVNISNGFLLSSLNALKGGKKIYTDTRMTEAGINKKAAKKLGIEVVCYIDDEEVASTAKERGITRSQVAMERAISEGITCFSIGNAPTALFKLLETVESDHIPVDFVIGVPVGFVGAAESKEELRKYGIAQISTVGNKGGSNVAASIVNALMYMLVER